MLSRVRSGAVYAITQLRNTRIDVSDYLFPNRPVWQPWKPGLARQLTCRNMNLGQVRAFFLGNGAYRPYSTTARTR